MKRSKISDLVTSLLMFGLLLITLPSVWAEATYNASPLAEQFGSSLNRPEKKRKEKMRPVVATKPSDSIVSKSNENNDNDLVRVDTDLVISDVLIFDKKGVLVEGLTQKDFTISEDREPQEIAAFSHRDTVLSRFVILIIDHSFSQLPYIATSIEAARVLVDKLNPNDRMAIVTDDVKLIAEPTSDKTFLKERLESLKGDALDGNLGKSKQYSALMAALNEMPDGSGRRPIIIFQTDGDQLSSLRPGHMYPGSNIAGADAFTYDEILENAERDGVTIYTVFSGTSLAGFTEREQMLRAQKALEEDMRTSALLQGRSLVNGKVTRDAKVLTTVAQSRLRDELAVDRIATVSGGLAQTLETPDQASQIYERILSDINRRYVIGYYPTNQLRDGKRRNVKIEVRGHPEYSIWGRKTYLAPAVEIAAH